MENFIGRLTRNTLFSLSVFASLCITNVSFAQVEVTESPEITKAYNIMGYVRDAETNEALPFANVIVTGTNFGAATNSSGYFVIVNAPADTCRLKVMYVGYAPQELVVNNTRPLPRPLIIKMKRETIELDGIVVSAPVQMLEVSDVPSQVAISPVEITVLPNVGEVDIFRALQLLPGISGVNEGSSGLYVRGGTPDQNLILFDGMTIYHVDHFFGFFSAFNADAIKDIRIYKGGFPAEFGGRTSSVVNLTGKTGDVNKVRYGMGLNLLSGHGVVEVPLSDKANFILSARRSYTDVVRSALYSKLFDFMSGGSQKVDIGTPGSVTDPNITMGEENPDFYFYDLNSKLTLTPSSKDIISLSIYSGRDNLGQYQELIGSEFEYLGEKAPFKDPGASLQIEQITKWGNFGVSAKWSRKIHDRFYSHLLLSHSSYFSKYDMNRSFNSTSGLDSLNFFRGATVSSVEDNKLEDKSVQLDNEWHLTNAHDLKIGLGFSRFDVRYFSTLNDTVDLVRRETHSVQGSGYLQDLWKLTPDIELTAGLRGTYYQKTSSIYYEPRAALVYSLSENFRLKGAWGRYYQFVNRIANENILEGSRDFWILSDNALAPGYAEHWIAGASIENDEYLLDVEGYYKDLEKMVEYSRRASYARGILFRNRDGEQLRGSGFFQGDGFSRGVDILVQKKRGRLTGWIGYSHGKVTYEFPELNNGRPYPASHDRTHEVSIVGKLSLRKWDLSATWVYATGKAYTVPESQYYLQFKDGTRKSYIHISDKNSYRLPDYHRLDLSLSRSFETRSTRYVMGLSIFNLYNNNNTWYRQFNLDTVPVAVTDVTMLSVTPTVYFQVYSK